MFSCLKGNRWVLKCFTVGGELIAVVSLIM
uniref:Uncharacterized protein n=1 Tax=Anguilla anguilla TaxID=7936 RepID=A0A0E9WD99_ANGAN